MKKKYAVDAGQYVHYCTLQKRKKAEGQDSLGGKEPKFEDEITFWASIVPEFGYQTINTGAQKGATSVTIETRYDALVKFTIGKRIVHNNRVFAIIGIVDVQERTRKMKVKCLEQEGVN